MTDWKDFIECERGLLIAPAGHGKTTAIADCLLQCPKETCQLVLTHTHAGIASLREKFQKKDIPPTRYQLETITGFAQRYVLSFYGTSVLPDEGETKYFELAVEKCRVLMQSKVVQSIVHASYDGIFVDEYQDCTIDQHNLIMALAYDLPLHLLGDPLQGIFSFEDKSLVNFDKNLKLFSRFNILDHPWRWEKTNPLLGQCILNIRRGLENGQPVKLDNMPNAGFYVINCNSNKYDAKIQCLIELIKKHECNSLLIICPSYHIYNKTGKLQLKGVLKDRIAIKKRIDHSNRFVIVDAIDSTEYYKYAKDIDSFVDKIRKGNRINKVARLYDLLKGLHLSISVLNKWIDRKNNSFVNKRAKEDKAISTSIREQFATFEEEKTLQSLNNMIEHIISITKMKCYHGNFYNTVKRCFKVAQTNDTSMFEAMKLLKTRTRHQGRKIEGRCIGTTLLTKGLEFDTVIIWEADKFEDAKNFYVAISRACKKLIIITETETLNFSH